jgi:hypothetical protein
MVQEPLTVSLYFFERLRSTLTPALEKSLAELGISIFPLAPHNAL